MADLPSGTVTFLFTDIEGSTAHWERDQAAMTAVELHLANTVCYGRRQAWIKKVVARRAPQDLPSTERERH